MAQLPNVPAITQEANHLGNMGPAPNAQFNQLVAMIQANHQTAQAHHQTAQAHHQTAQAHHQTAQANHQAVMQRLLGIEFILALQPMQIMNSTATSLGQPLRDQDLVPLQAPHPQTRDELLRFTANECQQSAAAFGLPNLGNNVAINTRRCQLARHLGVPF